MERNNLEGALTRAELSAQKTMPRPARQSRSLLLALSAASVMLATTLFGVFAYDDSWHTAQLAQVSEVASGHAKGLERHLTAVTSSAVILGSVLRHNAGTVEHFDEHAAAILETLPGITNLQLAPNGIISHIYPLEGHERALGHNILKDDDRRNEAWLAVTTRQMVLAGPFELVQGGTAIIARYPVFMSDQESGLPVEQFWGFASALIYLDQLISDANLGDLTQQGYHFTLSRFHPDSGRPETFYRSSGDAVLHHPITREVQAPNQNWQLTVGLVQPLAHSPLFYVQLASSLFSALVAGWLIHLLLKSPLHLKQLVQLRTAELEQEKSRSQQYLDTVSTVVLALDEQGRVTLLNRRGGELLGYGPDELRGKDWFDCCVPETERRRVRQGLFDASGIQASPEAYCENLVLTRNGERRLMAWHNVTIQESNGERRLLCAGQDITAEKAAESRLTKLSRAVEQSSTLVVILSRGGKIEYVNPYFCRVTGYQAQQVVGRQPDFLFAPRGGSSLIAMRRQLSRGETWRGERQYRKRGGEAFWVNESVSPIRDGLGEITHFVSVCEDITEQRSHLQVVERLAYYDQLTDLPNRRLFKQRLNEALAACTDRQQPLFLVYLDLNALKTVNDIHGHDAGDQLLQKAARKLLEKLPPRAILSRVGGDEFTLILTGISREHVQALARDLLSSLRAPFLIDSPQQSRQEVLVTANIGIASSPHDTSDAAELLKYADMAMYQAKKLGRNTYQFFTPALVSRARENHNLENDLRRALRDDEFVLYFQPQINLKTRQVTGFEALIRWNHGSKGLIFPDQFIALAEETGLIVAIGKQVIAKSCQAYRALQTQGFGHLRIAINLSALQFRDPLFVETFRILLAENQVPASQIELELTESTLMHDLEEAVQTLTELKGLGTTLAIDDFGTGYSSLSYLKRLPVDLLKVDRSFVKDIPEDHNDMEITTAVIAMARGLNLAVLAEGVETPAQQRFLEEQGCDLVQGYLYSPPVPEEQLPLLLSNLQQRLSATSFSLRTDAGLGG